MQGSTAFDAVLDEGRLEGEIRNSHRILLRQGQIRFGPVSSESEKTLRSITDLDRLERMVEAVLTATSWQELLATP